MKSEVWIIETKHTDGNWSPYLNLRWFPSEQGACEMYPKLLKEPDTRVACYVRRED